MLVGAIQRLDAFKEYLAKYAYAIANTQKNCGAVQTLNDNE